MTEQGVRLSKGHALWRAPWVAGPVGLLCLGLSLGLAEHPVDLASSYLLACLFFLSLGLGAMFFVLVLFVTRAGWGVSVRRMSEHVMATTPILGLMLVPLAGAGAFFFTRAATYLAVWTLVAYWFRRRSLDQDETHDPAIAQRLQTASAPALILYGTTVSFAAFDWIMSVQGGWYSTIFGVYFFAGCAVGFLALLAVALVLLPRIGLIGDAVGPEHLHSVGKLLFGFVAFWAYIAFSQYLLIWYAAIPEETIFYGQRLRMEWLGVARSLAVGHFVLPFFFLLPVEVKRRGATLAAAALWLLAMHYLDLYWLIMPALRGEHAAPQWVDLATMLGVGGVFLAAVCLLMRGGALIPIGDPRLPESLAAWRS